MPYLLKDKQCIQQITRPRMGKKRNPACGEVEHHQHRGGGLLLN